MFVPTSLSTPPRKRGEEGNTALHLSKKGEAAWRTVSYPLATARTGKKRKRKNRGEKGRGKSPTVSTLTSFVSREFRGRRGEEASAQTNEKKGKKRGARVVFFFSGIVGGKKRERASSTKKKEGKKSTNFSSSSLSPKIEKEKRKGRGKPNLPGRKKKRGARSPGPGLHTYPGAQRKEGKEKEGANSRGKGEENHHGACPLFSLPPCGVDPRKKKKKKKNKNPFKRKKGGGGEGVSLL